MKKTYLLIAFLMLSVSLFAQDSDLVKNALSYQEGLDDEYKDKDTSPLSFEQRAFFRGLPFFEINEDLIFESARFYRTPNESPFMMNTTKGNPVRYVKYGEVYFSINGSNYKLNVYQNKKPSRDPEEKNMFFIPFKDLTNGNTTYGGGRYIDVYIYEGETTVFLDFNRAYNPYCAYNTRYSCPIPPPANSLSVAIEAGVKYKNK